MSRIVIHLSLALSLFALVFTGGTYTADAGKKYRSTHGKSFQMRSFRGKSFQGRSLSSHRGKSFSYRGRSRHRYRRSGVYLQVPKDYVDDSISDEGYERQYYRGGPKIINVPDELRKIRRKRLLNKNQEF